MAVTRTELAGVATAAVLLVGAGSCMLDRIGRYDAVDAAGGGGSSADGGDAAGGMIGAGGDGAMQSVGGGGSTGRGGAGGSGLSGIGGIGGSIVGAGGGPPPLCSNGSVDAGEECDDGNLMAGDGCDGSCVVECVGGTSAKHPTTFHCYRYDDSALVTWDSGRTLCQALGSGWDLATVTSVEERDFIDNTLAVPEGTVFANDDPFQYWLGGRDFTQTDTFEWFSGETWSYAPWDDDPQDPSNGNQNCIRLRAKMGDANDVFRDAACTLTSSTLCELIPAGT